MTGLNLFVREKMKERKKAGRKGKRV